MAKSNKARQPNPAAATGSSSEQKAEEFNPSDFLNDLKSKDMHDLLKSGESINHTHLSKLLASNDTLSPQRTATAETTTTNPAASSSSAKKKAGGAPGGQGKPPKHSVPMDMYSSRDWMAAYAPGYQDMRFRDVFKSSDSMTSFPFIPPPAGASADWMRSMSASSNPTVAAPPADWMAMYESTWANPLQPLKMPPVATSASPTPKSPPKKAAATTKKSSTAGKKRKKDDSEEKQYVQYADNDVLLGRGGKANKHPGNIRYRAEIERTKESYQSTSKTAKTDVSQHLVDWVKNQGGRFLKKDPANNQWFVVSNIVARKKASQALREENTPEARAAKRAKYNHNKKH